MQAIKWFSEPTISEAPMVGIQGRALSMLYQRKFSVPPGFVLTTKVCRMFLAENNILPEVEKLMPRLAEGGVSDDELKMVSERLQKKIAAGTFSPAVIEAVREAYEILNTDRAQLRGASASALTILKNSYEPPFVAVRSSPAHEEQLSQSAAFMNVKGIEAVMQAIKACYQSVFAPEQLRVLASKGGELPGVAVIIQNMIDADISGTITRQGEVYVLEAVWGLGSLLSSDAVEPDRYEVRKEHEMMMLQTAKVGTKEQAMTRDASGKNIIVALADNRKQQQLLTAIDAQKLAKIGERAFAAFDMPQYIAFALTQGELHIVGCRPYITLPGAPAENAAEQIPASQSNSVQEAPAEALETAAEPLPSRAPIPSAPLLTPPAVAAASMIATNTTGRLGFRQGNFPIVYHAVCSALANDEAFFALSTIAQVANVVVLFPGHLSSTRQRAVSRGLEAVRRLASVAPRAEITAVVPHATQPRHFEDVRKLAQTLGVPEAVKLGIQLDTPAAVQFVGKFCEAGVQHIEIELGPLAQHLLGRRWGVNERELLSPAVVTALRYVHRQADRAGISVSIAFPEGAQFSPHDLDMLASNGAYAYSAPLSHASYIAHLVGAEMLWDAAKTPPESAPLPPASAEDIEHVVLAQLEAGEDDS